ncbi:MAG: glucose 1-dehydrogenase [Chloroflexi bacterium]|nr:glucose 1-dehydrogenase [Chloroflexota bacterium]
MAVYKPNFDLTDKVAIVTGGSRGIGFGIANVLAGAGAKIVIANRKIEQGEAAAKEIEGAGGHAVAIQTDVTVPESIEKTTQQVIERFGRIDILVNNAGRAVVKSAIDHTLEDWDKVMNTNLRAAFLFCRAVGPQMIKQGKGKVISIASTVFVSATPNRIAYVVSKAGVPALTKALAVEWAPYQINVNAIAPGFAETDLTSAYFREPDNLKDVLSRTPLGRIARPADFAGLALYLASEASDYVTGQTIFVDGGWTAV